MSVISLKTRQKYSSLLAGNAYYIPSAFESIASVTVGSSGAATVSFTNIPSNYQHLQIRCISETTSSSLYGFLRLNGDTGGNYTTHFLYGDGSSALATYTAGDTSIYATRSTSSDNVYWGCAILDFHDYAVTTKNKTIRMFTGMDANGSGVVMANSAVWLSTNAISSMEFRPSVSGNFRVNTTFALYGIKGA